MVLGIGIDTNPHSYTSIIVCLCISVCYVRMKWTCHPYNPDVCLSIQHGHPLAVLSTHQSRKVGLRTLSISPILLRRRLICVQNCMKLSHSFSSQLPKLWMKQFDHYYYLLLTASQQSNSNNSAIYCIFHDMIAKLVSVLCLYFFTSIHIYSIYTDVGYGSVLICSNSNWKIFMLITV